MSLKNKLKEMTGISQLTISAKIAIIYALMYFFILTIVTSIASWGINEILEIKDIQTKNDFVSLIEDTFFLMNILGFFASIVIGYFVSKRMLSPIKHITATVNEITESELNKRISQRGPDDELKELIDTFNDMIARLEDAFERQKQFVSDASHELRTPITVIQGYNNMLARWGKNDREVLEESIDAINKETISMKKLIEKLLMLARYDNATLKVDLRPIILNDLVEEIYKETKMIDDKHHIYLDIKTGQVNVIGDENLLKQLLRIILENAMKYTEEGGNIYIELEKEQAYAFITIIDTGIGIPPEDIPHIFERFYRADKSRSKATGGHGLGLNIAKAIVDTHGGKISVKSDVGVGTRIVIQLQSTNEN